VKVRHVIIGGSEKSLIFNDLDKSERIKVYDRGIDLSAGTGAATSSGARFWSATAAATCGRRTSPATNRSA
jgi:hypothetical protein